MLLFLTYRWKIFLNTLRFSKGKQKYSRLAGMAGILFLFGYLFYLSNQFLGYVLTESGWQQKELLLQNGTAILFNGFFLLLFFNSITGTAKSMYESPEMQLLLSLPIRLRTVITIKIFDQAFRNAASFGILGLGVLAAFGFQSEQPLLFSVAILPAVFFFIIIPTAAGLMVTFLVTRFFSGPHFSGPRLRGISSSLSALAGLGLWFLLHSMQSRLEAPGDKTAYLQQITNFNGLNNTPAGWLSRSAAAFLFPNQTGWMPLLLLVFTSLIFLFLCIWVMQQHYLKYGVVAPGQTAIIKNNGSRGVTNNNMTAALIIKDLRLLTRDSRLLMQLIISVFVMLFIGYRTGSSLRTTVLTFSPENISFFSAASVMLAIIAARTASMLSPLERHGYWLLKTAPIMPEKLVRSKFFLALLVAQGAIGLCLVMLLTVHHITLRTAFLLWVHFSILSIPMCSIGIYLGITAGNPDWEHPKRMLNPRGQILLPVFGIIGAVVAVFSWWGLSAVSTFPTPLNHSVALATIGIIFSLVSRELYRRTARHFTALEPKL